MGALATCKFPFVDEFKKAADNNRVLAFIDSVLSGYGQIGFNDNPVSGILFIIGTFAGSFQNGVCSLICTVTAAALGFMLGVPKISMRLGLYTFNAALAGMGVGLFIFAGQENITVGMIVMSIICGVICVFLTGAFSALLSRWNVPSLALPYCTALFVLVSASLFVPALGPSTSVIPNLGEMTAASEQAWSIPAFIQAYMNNFAEILWQANWLSGAFFLAGVIVASRIDFLSVICASFVATVTAILLNMPMDNILIGIYGYNAVLLTMIMVGRGYEISLKSLAYALFLAVASVFVTAGMTTVFAPLGVPVAAFPYALMAICAMLGKEFFKGLKPIDSALWGVPETIRKTLKQDQK